MPSPPVPVLLCLSEFLSKIGTHFLASSDIMEKNRNSLAWLRNAGSYFAMTYCMPSLEEPAFICLLSMASWEASMLLAVTIVLGGFASGVGKGMTFEIESQMLLVTVVCLRC